MSELQKGMAPAGLGALGGIAMAYNQYRLDARKKNPNANPSFKDFWNQAPIVQWAKGSEAAPVTPGKTPAPSQASPAADSKPTPIPGGEAKSTDYGANYFTAEEQAKAKGGPAVPDDGLPKVTPVQEPFTPEATVSPTDPLADTNTDQPEQPAGGQTLSQVDAQDDWGIPGNTGAGAGGFEQSADFHEPTSTTFTPAQWEAA